MKGKEILKLIKKYGYEIGPEAEETILNDLDKNMKNVRYIIFEDYNLYDDFYWRCHNENEEMTRKEQLMEIFEDYFSDCEGDNDIAVIDVKEKKIITISKETKYHIKEKI